MPAVSWARQHQVEESSRELVTGKRGDPRGPEKEGVTAPARREVMRVMVDRGLSARRALAIVAMSATAFRYVPLPDPNGELRERILALAHRHTRYGAGLIYLELRQAGLGVSHKARGPRVCRGASAGEATTSQEGARHGSPAIDPPR